MQFLRNRVSKLNLYKIRNPNLNSSLSQNSTNTRAISIRSVEELKRFSSTGNGEEAEMKGQSFSQNPPETVPNRPLRGGKPFNPQAPPPRFAGKNSATIEEKGNNPSEDDDFLEKFKFGFSNSEDNKREKPQESAPELPSPPPQPEDADEVLKKMEGTGLIPCTVAMLDGLCEDGLFQDAMKLFRLLREKGTIPEVVVYTGVVEGYCKAQKFDDAVRVFRMMQTNGIAPNAFSYSVLIQGLYKCNKLEDAVEFSLEMLEAGYSPNVSTFVGLVDGFCKEKGVEEAQKVIEQLKEKGYLMNEKKAVEFLDKKEAFSDMIWEAIFGKEPNASEDCVEVSSLQE